MSEAPPVEEKNECVKVVVRMRPFNQKEKDEQEQRGCSVDTKTGSVSVLSNDTESGDAKQFTFDRAYDDTSTQRAVFVETARPIIDSVIEGFNGTIFAYGQTGTGKTFTMEGVASDENLRGIMPNSFSHIFDYIDSKANSNIEFLVRASFLEIYLDEVYDLLNSTTRAKMEVKESKDKGIFVKDLSTYVVKNANEIAKVMRKGQKSRQVGATAMNPGSSRSHSIFTIMIETCEVRDGENHYRAGKLNLVDLAGSERQKKTGAGGERLDEAKAINLSLSALGNVIKALVSGKAKHVPFRDSKLTRLLQDSLGGNTKTVMIANFGPAASNIEETVSTLRYADRAKHIKNKPRINEDPKDTALRAYMEEIEQLKAQLAARKNGTVIASTGSIETHDEMRGVEGLEEEVVVVEKVVNKVVDMTDQVLQQKKDEIRSDLANLQSQAQKEKDQFLAKQSEAAKKASEYEQQLSQKQQQLSKEQQEMAKLEQIIAEREAKLLHGGQILDQAAKQREELTRAEKELADRLAAEQKLKADLMAAEQNEAYMKQQYVSQEQELEIKTMKLKQLWAGYKSREQELAELQDEFAAEREELMDHLRQLTREIRLRDAMLESFMPLSALQLIEERAQWDAVNDQWHIPGIEYAGNHMRRADPPDELYRPAPISYERLSRMVGGSIQQQQLLSLAASAATCDAEYECVINGAPVPVVNFREPYLSYGTDEEKMARKLEKRRTQSEPQSAMGYKRK